MSTPFQLPEGFNPNPGSLSQGDQALAQAQGHFRAQRAESALNANPDLGGAARLPGGSNAQSDWWPQASSGGQQQQKPSWGSRIGNALSGWGNGVSNGNGGDDELATKGDVNEAASGLHDRLGSIESGMQNAGGVQDRNNAFSQGNGSAPAPQAAGTQRPGVQSPLTADFAAQRLNMQAYQANVHDSIETGRASFRQRAANWAAATPHGLSPSLSGNAMSASQGSNTMNGLVSGGNAGGNGMSASTFEKLKWGQQ